MRVVVCRISTKPLGACHAVSVYVVEVERMIRPKSRGRASTTHPAWRWQVRNDAPRLRQTIKGKSLIQHSHSMGIAFLSHGSDVAFCESSTSLLLRPKNHCETGIKRHRNRTPAARADRARKPRQGHVRKGHARRDRSRPKHALPASGRCSSAGASSSRTPATMRPVPSVFSSHWASTSIRCWSKRAATA